MKNISLIYLFLFSACNSITGTTEAKFEREEWLRSNNWEDHQNPRLEMTHDLLDNYLKPGLTRDSLLSFLGQPHDEQVVQILIEGSTPPDSLNPENFNEIEDPKKANQYVNWFLANRQADTLITFHVGWRYDFDREMLKPNFLVVKMNADSVASDFWIEEK